MFSLGFASVWEKINGTFCLREPSSGGRHSKRGRGWVWDGFLTGLLMEIGRGLGLVLVSSLFIFNAKGAFLYSHQSCIDTYFTHN